jgi:ATP-dependent DNA helicase RecG
MPAEEKDAVMSRFVRGEIHILVATTVIEVGIDVPNATCLLVEHPERYGLSQLHQLRGRVGRGRRPSVCVLFRGRRLPGEVLARLETFARTDDGFALAEVDLSLRGQGDLAGTRQHGRPEYRVADVWQDARMIEVAREDARVLLDRGAPDLGWEPLRRALGGLLQAYGDLVEAG